MKSIVESKLFSQVATTLGRNLCASLDIQALGIQSFKTETNSTSTVNITPSKPFKLKNLWEAKLMVAGIKVVQSPMMPDNCIMLVPKDDSKIAWLNIDDGKIYMIDKPKLEDIYDLPPVTAEAEMKFISFHFTPWNGFGYSRSGETQRHLFLGFIAIGWHV